jgi:hypothetical protein
VTKRWPRGIPQCGGRPPTARGRGALTPAFAIAVVGILASIFIAIGFWLHAEIQEVRRTTAAARVGLMRARESQKRNEARLDEACRSLAAWSAWSFTVNCQVNHGSYDANSKSCRLPDGRILRYEPLFPSLQCGNSSGPTSGPATPLRR